AIDGIPAIIVDPKGDLGNLLLTFPQLRAEDFAPWIDPAEAARKGQSQSDFAAATAETWRKGLADWGQSPERIQKLRDAADIAVFTPGSSAGLPLAALKSFQVPPANTLSNADALREAVSAAASGLLGLVGIEADPLASREHILLASILDRSWREGQGLDMAGLIRAVQSPPLDKIGVMDLESFFPAKERFALAMQLNNVLASPSFAAWTDGEPLDVQRLLFTPEGKPRLSILSIAHLSDAERMFFVTLLLSEVIGWMRQQSGTSSLRALFYMDEVFGYFPPSANPPSKTPMLTLLKQARAFGLGIVLATQNPVDLDYKGLANCGTWLLGRLQTERDKLRVLDGLEGASSAAGASFDRGTMEKILSGLGNRIFLMNNVHEDAPVVFQTRWAMSYLRGPLTREQIATLMAPRKTAMAKSAPPASEVQSSSSPATPAAAAAAQRPVLPPEIVERFVPRNGLVPSGGKVLYRPAVLGSAKVHFAQSAARIDVWKTFSLLAAVDETAGPDLWTQAAPLEEESPQLEPQPETGAAFAELPPELSRPKTYAGLTSALKDHLYRHQKVALYKCAALKQVSQPGESESDFRVRLSQRGREARDATVETLRQKYAPKIATLTEQIRKARARVEREQAQASQQTFSTMVSVGSSILSAVFGRKLMSSTNVTRAASSARAASRAMQQRQDVTQAGETVEALEQRLADLDAKFKAETEKIETGMGAAALELEEISVQPKKADIAISQVALAWVPWIVKSDGTMQQASAGG
ncbi:MAG TPA: ATP-binding protein, partial [Pirellulaceae bacterium]|nr:ATP-binding protein [Pirellulaceae bacterium]